MNRIIYNHYSHGISYSFQQNAEDCADQFSSMATSLPNQLTKFGTCLKTSVDMVPTIVAPVQEIFELVRKDFISLNKQLNICAGSSINCITQYFMTIDMELNSIMSGITMAGSMLTYHLSDSRERNSLCADLVSYNCEDLNEGLMRDFQRCIYPPV
ncbi:uncharacterized protein LOC110675453 [Aedes aegypti]|uniref:Uncharacterized protein n=1 Tax=Aedes aegypti TaxID=7159 RepID=A0A6I8U801_AEDAE|nr:uncharacterized protein LOC110675453 [Aedes aegypti]